MSHECFPSSVRIAALLFCCFCLPAFVATAAAQTAPLVLLSEQTSTRALALESVTFSREPFPLNSLISWSSDPRTRVLLFALNLQLQPGDDPSTITADAEDGSHRHYDLMVEAAGPVPGQNWMSSLTLRLSNEMSEVGDVLVRVTYKGRASNRVRIGIGHIGGGPPDDAGSRPTSPYLLRGIVTADGAALAGVVLILQGNGSIVGDVTNGAGEYLIVTVGGDYVLSASKTFYDFNPPTRTFNDLGQALDGVNFTASRQQRTIQGVALDDNGQPVPNVEMTLTSSAVPPRTATTDATGVFSFANVPAGFAYTISPGIHNIFAFTPQTIDQLTETTMLTFSGLRRTYLISGRVTDQNGALAAAVVTLQETGATSTTDTSGNYSLPGVKAGFDYTIAVIREDYVFEPPSVVLPLVDGNRQLDFHGSLHVFLRGRIVDQDGRGVFGVKINISGTQSGVAATAADGSYSFLVTAFGNYTLSPWKEQDYYSFTPNTAALTALKGNRVADFAAVLNAGVSPSYVLEFDGSPKTVDYSMPILTPVFDYNLFWLDGRDFGHFFWEFWAMPGENAGGTYMISDGYGGAHAILFGVANFGAREPNRYQLLGNIWNGSSLTYFSSDEGPAPNEWGHFAAGWDGVNIVTYFNGVPVGKTAWVGPRITPGGIQGCGRLLIGGSDHSNFIGRIAQVRGYEQNNPLEAIDKGAFGTFAPQTVFAVDGNLLSYFFRPSQNIADLSRFGQNGIQHPSLLRSTRNGVLNPCSGCPLPQFVVDPSAPDFSHPNNPGTPPAPVDTPPPVPGSALIFDSFSRRNSTYALSGLGGLGSTEGGTAGTRTWKTNQAANQPQPFGILNGRAVLLANTTAVTWTNAPAGVADLDISVDRHAGVWGTGQNTGLSFRVTDSSNYFFAYSKDGADASRPQTLTVGYYAAGVRTDLTSGVSLPASWTTLRVVTSGAGTISVYADNTLLYSTTNDSLANSTGAGLYNNAAGLALTNRWDNFRVFSVP
ncbi:MAG TPA: carboxypeptidase regulatory-like domain-containing protein [Pyrinomonadaceae bacterium]|nr:carboxypeptidase regulatory-like domain-containing protein [Pyrinomonadaceae bacterium]